ncbi:MAG: substrate-binding domain-containing protein [Pirellula sp.]
MIETIRKPRRRVVLLVETSTSYGRSLLSGIVRFVRMHDEWSLYLEQRDLTASPPSWLSDWRGDGIISRVTTPGLIETVAKTGVPVVDLTDRYCRSGLPLVRTDDQLVGRMAAEHLMERGFKRFGFVGFPHEAWSARRLNGFQNYLAEHGHTCSIHNSVWLDQHQSTWDTERDRLADWVRTLEMPCGIMACNDVCGHNVLAVCNQEGLAVPEETAVVGVDNDELLCRACDPALSSVMVNAEGVGYRAAELLATLMDGSIPKDSEQIIAPLGVSVRQSTDVVAIEDPTIATALQYIRQNACRGISVEDVLKNASLSRSSLERKVRKHLGRTPQEEIRHVQVKRAKELLTTTDLSAEKIASLCGFEHSEYMYVVFKRHVGMTPGEFRTRSLQG